jgi:hypothetical protein
MVAWSDDGRLVKPVMTGRRGSNGYVAKETALTSSRRLGVIAEDVSIHEQFLLEFWGQNGYYKLPNIENVMENFSVYG